MILYNLYLDFDFYILFVSPLLFINFSLLGLLISITSVYMSINSHRYHLFIDQNKIVRDELKEDAIYLKRYNEQLKIDREKNIHIAVLTERNRIARELHDSIGHVLSSSILQVEALKISSDDLTNEGLAQLQDTLSNGMDDIRNSIHNLHRESFDLKSRIDHLLGEMQNIDVELSYRIEEDLSYDLKFDIVSVIKEGITNCVKHSDATKLNISLIGQPKFYTIIIKDNGSSYQEDKIKSSDGIGLISMNEIAEKYNGFLNYGYDSGFKIHITLMKG
ncbi:MAG: two-component sensor histidine kinase [Tissierella sp.]|nr:two-component sensor histidine kinase [Tissierella sp.]